MSDDRSYYLEELRSRNLLPDSHLCVFEAGSLVRGWGNPSSDVDLYIVSEEPWDGPEARSLNVPLTKKDIPSVELFVDGMRWDIKYWTDQQVDEVFEKVTWEAFERAAMDSNDLNYIERWLLHRFGFAVAASGQGWLAERGEQLKQSAFPAFLISQALNLADSRVEDAVGQLQAGDLESAVLSGRAAFAYSVDALIAYHGEYGQGSKWRARRFRAAEPALLSFEEYWGLETMQSYDPADPAAWVNEVLPVCRAIAMEVSI
ncbi:hypothetical protein ABT095_35330 [Kitasatospora sp. NPDC002227]|uniref:hypothetical protein n=1 Tax=Kitasatospora sp. NPDC002227 TaxID=3154773 RepID=UPI00331EDE9C